MGKVLAICTSKEKGIGKNQINETNLIFDFGLEGDAHGGKWHRQVSFLDNAKIQEFIRCGGNVKFGDFGENFVLEGIDLENIKIGDKLEIGQGVIEITQIGKECHTKCNIFKTVGHCIMPKNGIFGKILKGGKVLVGDTVKIL